MHLLLLPLALLCLSLGTLPGDDPPPKPAQAATIQTAPGRLVAIGDVHGDLAATRDVLQLVGALDDSDTWIGGTLTIVQLGDQVDRGPDDREVLDFLAALQAEARAAGGALILLNGNHELMNVAGDFRYVADDAWAAFDAFDQPPYPESLDLDGIPKEQRGRRLAFHPGGTYARLVAERDVVAIVGDTLFVHGGVLPDVVEYGIDRLNAETRAWARGDGIRPQALRGSDSPVWSRHYSHDTTADDCEQLAEVLERLGLRRMVVAHTVQTDGITSACDERVWRIDVGMSAHYGGSPQALEIVEDGVRVLE